MQEGTVGLFSLMYVNATIILSIFQCKNLKVALRYTSPRTHRGQNYLHQSSTYAKFHSYSPASTRAAIDMVIHLHVLVGKVFCLHHINIHRQDILVI